MPSAPSSELDTISPACAPVLAHAFAGAAHPVSVRTTPATRFVARVVAGARLPRARQLRAADRFERCRAGRDFGGEAGFEHVGGPFVAVRLPSELGAAGVRVVAAALGSLRCICPYSGAPRPFDERRRRADAGFVAGRADQRGIATGGERDAPSELFAVARFFAAVSLPPYWVQFVPERVKAHAAPWNPLSTRPPSSAVSPLGRQRRAVAEFTAEFVVDLFARRLAVRPAGSISSPSA